MDSQKVEQDKERREKNYSKALEKAAEETKPIFEEEDDSDLVASLTRARESAASKRKNTSIEEVIAQRVQQNTKMRENQQTKEEDSSSSLIFTDTTEFIRAIQLEDAPQSKKKTTNEQMEIESALAEELEEHQKVIQSSLKNKKSSSKKGNEDNTNYNDNQEMEENNEDNDNDNDNDNDDDDSLANSGSLAATLNLIKQRGKEDTDVFAGRKTDKRPDMKDDTAPDIRLDYLDELGRPMTQKEAFRKLSHKFHGKKPGKNKQEKRIKQQQEEQRKRGMSSTDTPLRTVQAMQMEQERTQSPYIVLSGANISKSASASVRLSKPNNSISSSSTGTTSPSSRQQEESKFVEETTTPSSASSASELSSGSFQFKMEFAKKQKLK